MQQERAASLRAGKAPELQEGRPDDDCGTEWTGVLWCSMLVAGADGLVSTGLNWSGAAASTYVVPTSWPAGMSGPVNYLCTN